jgi:septal ring factor EnvC (AmiA/AmiB activator)
VRRAAALWLVLALPAGAAPVDDLVAATEGLDTARAHLKASLDSDPLPALASVVQAYDDALAALRAAERETLLARKSAEAALAAKGAELSRVLAALQAAGGPTTAERILHPAGPLGAARAAMLMSAAAPALEARAAQARTGLEDLETLDKAIAVARARLTAGAATARAARVALAGRAHDAAPFAPGETLNRLEASAASLQAATLAVAESPAGRRIAAEPPPGNWPLPVKGAVLRRFNEPDAGGTPRPGLVVATAPGAILTAPAAMTVRFLGTIRGYGNVMILEPDPGYLLVLTGFAEALVAPDQVVAPGAPLGLMADPPTPTEGPAAQDSGQSVALTQTLYVETRVSGESVDPAKWFALDKE